METVSLIRISDNKPVTKSLQNWNALPKESKAKYRVVDGEQAQVTKVPDEVVKLRSKKAGETNQAASTQPPASDTAPAQTTGAAPEETKSGANATTVTKPDVSPEGIAKRYDELTGSFEERRKIISNETGQHWRTVDKILKDAGKK